MWWMWIVGPVLVLIIYVLTGRRDRFGEAEVERWRSTFWPRTDDELDGDGNYRKAPGKKAVKQPGPGAKKVMTLPGPLHRMILAAGGGDPVQRIELVPKLAYLAAMEANATCGSDHQTVVARLEEAAPQFTVRPLPILEGERIANNGVELKKDPEFMALFLVEAGLGESATGAAVPVVSADLAKKIRAWLSRPVRDALRDLPDVWLRVDEKSIAVSLYGRPDAEKIDQLVNVADVIFAEYGAGGGPSLFGLEDDDEDDEGDEGDDEAPALPPAKKSKPAAPAKAKKADKPAPAKR